MNQLDKLEAIRTALKLENPGADPQDIGRAAMELACDPEDDEVYVVWVNYREETLGANPDPGYATAVHEGPWTYFEPRYCGPWSNTRPCVGDIVKLRRSEP